MTKVSTPLRPQWNGIPQAQFRDTFKQLQSLQDLANFWGLKPFQLSYYAFKIDKTKAYNTYLIPRRNGRERRIEAPIRTLKFIQRIIHESLSRVYGPHPAVHGFRSHRSIITNANRHTGRQFVLNIDLKDFFPSITRKRIYGRLVASPYEFNSSVANVIAALATDIYLRLPQGSPCSPILANMVAAGLDSDLAKLCGSLYCRYTRYADDITISTSRNTLSPDLARYPNALGTGQVIIGDRLRDVIERHNFQINDRKCRLQSNWTRQICTGIVVNNQRITPPRKYIRRLRALIDHWKKDGWQSAAQGLHDKENRELFTDRSRFKNHALGRITYLRMVRESDGATDPISDRLERIVASIPANH